MRRSTLLRIAIAGLGLAAGLALLRADLFAQAAVDGAAFALKGQLTQGGWARGVAPRDALSLSFNGRRVPLAPDGGFFIAFDRDSGPRGELRAELQGGTSAAGAVAISPRAWQIERIPIGPRPGTAPNEEYARRRVGELALINGARRKDHHVSGWRQKFIWPVYGRISGRFGSQRIYNGTPGSYHSGVDVATGASGTPFVAPADGVAFSRSIPRRCAI